MDNADFRGNYFTDSAGAAIEFQLWRSGSYLTGIDIDGNVFNRNSWDTDQVEQDGAITLVKYTGCLFSPSGTIANTLYYQVDPLLDSNGCSDSITETANTDVGSAASFSVSSKDFSSVQGTNNWRYRYSTDTGSTWTDMGYYDSSYDNQLNDRWRINSSTTHPYLNRFQTNTGSATSSAVARQWTAPSAGTINIRSRVLKYETGGDGVHARITKNGANLWPASGWQLIGASDQVGVAANLSSVSVASGDLIRFELKNNANYTNDRTSWQPMITFVSGGGGGETSLVVSHTVNGTLRNDVESSDVGMRVVVGASPITVTKIGRYYVSGNSQTHPLKIIRKSDFVQVASASVNMGAGTPDGLGFKYATLGTPVTLSANTTYYVVSDEFSGGDQWYDSIGVDQVPTSVATLPGSVYGSGSSWTENGDSSNDSYGPMNLKYSS